MVKTCPSAEGIKTTYMFNYLLLFLSVTSIGSYGIVQLGSVIYFVSEPDVAFRRLWKFGRIPELIGKERERERDRERERERANKQRQR